jgi:hypothetical protein
MSASGDWRRQWDRSSSFLENHEYARALWRVIEAVQRRGPIHHVSVGIILLSWTGPHGFC